jgi:hypothetical protein
MLQLTLQCTAHAAELNGFPVTIWEIVDASGAIPGVALVAEVVAIPGDGQPAARTRKVLKTELYADIPAEITVSPTSQLAERSGAPPRMRNMPMHEDDTFPATRPEPCAGEPSR